VPTPPVLAAWVCRRALDLWRADGGGRGTSRPPRVLDPAVGDGVFLVETARASDAVGRRCKGHLFGVDIQPDAVRRARCAVPDARIVVGNYLLDRPPGPGSYDLIVGNPPYLGQRDVTRLEYGRDLYDRYGVKDDLYVYFLLRSLDLLADGGVLAMVTSDSWLTLMGKEPLRRRMLQHRLDHVIRLPSETFAARIHACCFGLVRGVKADKVRTFDASACRPSDVVFQPRRGRCVPQAVYRKAPGAMIFDPTPDNVRLHRAFSPILSRWQAGAFSRRERSGPWRVGDVVPLEAVARVVDVGVHSRNCRHRLFFADKVRGGLQRLLQGRQIDRWCVRWDAPSARYRWVDIGYRPRPGVKGIGRSGRPSRRDEYWDFQGDPAIHHAPERILIRQTGDAVVAAYLAQNGRVHYTDNTLFTCLPSDRGAGWGLTYRYLLGYLNSAATHRLYQFLSQERSRRQAQVKIRWLRMLPFRLPSRQQVGHIDTVVDRIIHAHQQGRPDDAQALVDECNTHFDAMLADA